MKVPKERVQIDRLNRQKTDVQMSEMSSALREALAETAANIRWTPEEARRLDEVKRNREIASLGDKKIQVALTIGLTHKGMERIRGVTRRQIDNFARDMGAYSDPKSPTKDRGWRNSCHIDHYDRPLRGPFLLPTGG